MDWEKYSYVIGSKYRKESLIVLSKKPTTPVDISEETGYPLTHVSRALSEMRERDLIKCLTPQKNKNRIYKIKNEGLEIVNQIEE